MKTNRVTTVIMIVIIALLSTATIYSFKDKIFPQEQTTEEVEVKGDTVNTNKVIEKEILNSFSSFATPRNWYVLTPENEDLQLHYEITDASGNAEISYKLNEETYKAKYINNYWDITIPISELSPDKYTLTIEAHYNDQETKEQYQFNVSEPVYVAWTIDWEGFDVKEEYLKQMAQYSDDYDAPMTHFFNPYIYIYLSDSRAQYLTDWVKDRDEAIGLHLHMYNKLIETAGVEVDNNPAWGSPMGQGHDTPNSNYGYDDYKKIISWSLNQFDKNGLEKPTMYRAGGWYIDEENLKVLNEFEFLLDSSGRTKYIHGRNSLPGHWDLSLTQQPYQLNSSDQNITNNPNLTLWEYPNNGADSWAYSSEQLIERFKSNHSSNIETETKVVTYVTHPHWFDKEGPNIKGALEYISKYSYAKDNGPVIFTTLDKVHQDIAKL